MSAGDVEAGKAYVRVTADDKVALAAVDRLSKRFRSMGATISGVGVKMGGSIASSVGGIAGSLGIQRLSADAAAAAMVGAGLIWSNAASAAVDLADRLGTSVEAVTGLSYAAEQSGASTEDLEKGMQKLKLVIGQAAAGSKSAAAALGEIGLSAGQLQGLAPEDQFRLIADRLAGISDPALRAAMGAQIFGKGFAKLAPLIANGAAGIDELVARAKHLGIVLDDDSARAAEAFGDGLADLKHALMGNVYAIGGALVPILADATAWLTEAAASVGRFVRENREIVKVAFMIFSAFTAAGVGLWAFGSTLGLIGKALSFVGPLIAVAKVAIVALGSAFAFLTSPIGIATAAIVGIGAYLAATTTDGAALLDWLRGRFAQLAADATEAWGGISAALAAGDLGLAARIAFGFVSLEAAKAYRAVFEVWYGFKNWFIGLFADAWFGAVVVAAGAIAKLETWWAEGVGFFGNLWDRFTNGFKQAWNSATGWISKQWTKVMGLISSDVDVEAEISRIDQETTAANSSSQQQTDASIAARGQKKDDRLKQIEQDRADATAGAVQLADEGEAKRREASAAELKKMSDEIEQSRGEYAALLTEAKDKKAAADAAQKPETKRPDPVAVGGLMSSKSEQGPGGSFNAAASIGFAKSGTPLQEIIGLLKETNEHTSATAKNTRDGVAFA